MSAVVLVALLLAVQVAFRLAAGVVAAAVREVPAPLTLHPAEISTAACYAAAVVAAVAAEAEVLQYAAEYPVAVQSAAM